MPTIKEHQYFSDRRQGSRHQDIQHFSDIFRSIESHHFSDIGLFQSIEPRKLTLNIVPQLSYHQLRHISEQRRIPKPLAILAPRLNKRRSKQLHLEADRLSYRHQSPILHLQMSPQHQQSKTTPYLKQHVQTQERLQRQNL